MADTIKMPGGGNDIRVVRKEDILNCIDANIVDKDVMRAFIERFEVDATNFLSQGRWTSLPYIGTLRKNKYKQMLNSEENKSLNQDAKETLDRNKYIVFRKNLNKDIASQIKYDRIYRYTTSQVVKKNQKFYKHLVSRKGEVYARLVCYTLHVIKTNEL